MRFGSLITILALAAAPAFAEDPASAGLPGGASALNERHGNWSVSCTTGEAGKDCAFSQSVGNPTSGAALLAVELGAPAGDSAEGMMITAFGLRLDAGVTLAIDGAALGGVRPFLTCVATGCLVPLAFDAVALAALRSGEQLQVTAVRVDNGQPVVVPLSLAGFTAAFDRTADLGR